MNYLVIILIIVFMLFYLQCYFKFPKDFSLIQTTLFDFTPDIYLEKQPIYLFDQIVNPADLLNTLFKYQYWYHILSLSKNNFLKQNLSKWVIIYNDGFSDTTISIMHPEEAKKFQFLPSRFIKKNYRLCQNSTVTNACVDILLKPKKNVFIPMNWMYKTNADNLLEIHLHDPITCISSFII